MIIKNHTIELKDTSASEMARFRQIMLGIWRQEIEDDKNGDEVLQYLKEKHQTAKSLDAKYAETLHKPEEINLLGDRYILNNDNHYQYTYASPLDEVVVAGYISPLTSILNWIKNNIGNNAKELKLDSLPENTQVNFLSDIKKGYQIDCNRYQFETIVDLKNIEFGVYFKPLKTFFLLGIFDPQKNLVFRFQTDTYEGLEYLANFIDYDLEKFKATITKHYKIAIAAAGNDKDKLDIIYEVIPDFILAALKTNQELYEDIDILLNQNTFDLGGRDEDQGILNILRTLQKKDANKLYEKLHKNPLLVMKLYETFSGDDKKNFVGFIMGLCSHNKKIPNKEQKIYLPDGYWLSNVQLNANWSSNNIVIENSSTLLTNLGNLFVSSSTITRPKEPIGLKTLYKGSPLNPMDFIAVKSVLGMDKDNNIISEASSNQIALFIKYKVDELSEKTFWNVINVASTLAGGYGAIEVLATEGTGKLLKTLAVIELTKTVVDLVMLSDNAQKALKEAGLEFLVDNWTTISITADLTFLSLDLLISLAKYGRKGVKILKDVNETEHAAHLEKQTEKTFIEIEKKTGVDVSEMTEKEIEDYFDYLSKWEGNPKKLPRGITETSRGAKKLSKKEIKAYIKKIDVISNGESELIILPKGDRLFVENKAAASFNAANGKLYVQKGVTDYELFHEFKHFEEFKKIGKDEYMKGIKGLGGDPTAALIRKYKREKYVFDEIMKNKTRFNEKEIEHANWYINDVIKDCNASGIDINKIK